MSTIKADNFTWKSGEAGGQPSYTVSADKVILGTAKSWINFNGQTTSIRKSFNVSSLTNNATGSNYFNLTSAMPDASFTVSGFCSSTMTYGGHYAAYDWPGSVSTVWTYSGWSGTMYNLDYNGAAVHR